MRTAVVVLTFILACGANAASPRIAFERDLPAPHDLGGAKDVALANAVADARSEAFLEPFVAQFVEQANRGGHRLQLRDARFTTGPADAYLAIKTFKCETVVRESEGSARDTDGNRVKRTLSSVEAVCVARIEVLSRVMKAQSTYVVRGEGRSSRVETIAEDERDQALLDAVRYAALDAAERIRPRRVRETVVLDDKAPAFEEGFAMIAADQLGRARQIWEAALRKEPRSAALRFNLAALCEALGDRRAAEQHYTAASAMAPAEPRYANELKLFARRGVR
jgi:tetratricopeptide (TPR) repeat protein